MDDELDEEGEDALYEYLFGHEAAVSWEEEGSREGISSRSRGKAIPVPFDGGSLE
jgi:hypothetical protein